jgi:hypothetical protein
MSSARRLVGKEGQGTAGGGHAGGLTGVNPMNRHLEFHPDLEECLLEDRALMAVIVPSLPWLTVTSGFGSGSGPGGGASSISNLPPLPGPPVMSVGGMGSLVGMGTTNTSTMVSGTLFAFYGAGYNTASGGPSGGAAIGSGANASGGGGGGTPSTSVGYGATFNSGYSTSLNAQNSYGMGPSTAAIGQTTSGNEAPLPQEDANQAEVAAPSQGQEIMNPNTPSLGVDVRPQDNLLKGGVRTTTPRGVTGR